MRCLKNGALPCPLFPLLGVVEHMDELYKTVPLYGHNLVARRCAIGGLALCDLHAHHIVLYASQVRFFPSYPLHGVLVQV